MTRSVKLTPLSAIEPKPVRWLWKGRIPAGELTLLAGPEGLGKSTFLAHIAAEATHGRLPGDFLGTPQAVVIAALEDDEASTLRPRLEAAGADLDLVASIRVTANETDAALQLPDDTAALMREVLRPGLFRAPVGLLILDPIKSAAVSTNGDRDSEVRALLSPLVHLAQQNDVTVLPSGHFKKGSTTEDRATWKVSGSPAWTQVPRSTLFFAEDPELEDDDSARVIAHAKCNVGRLQPALTARVHTAHIAAPNGSMIETSRLVIGAESTVRADEIGQRGGVHVQRDDAEQFLRTYLSDGELHLRQDIVAAASREGISDSTLQRARKALKVRVRREGSGQDHRSLWSLPTGDKDDDMCDLSGTSPQIGTPTPATPATPATPDPTADELDRADHLLLKYGGDAA